MKYWSYSQGLEKDGSCKKEYSEYTCDIFEDFPCPDCKSTFFTVWHDGEGGVSLNCIKCSKVCHILPSTE